MAEQSLKKFGSGARFCVGLPLGDWVSGGSCVVAGKLRSSLHHRDVAVAIGLGSCLRTVGHRGNGNERERGKGYGQGCYKTESRASGLALYYLCILGVMGVFVGVH